MCQIWGWCLLNYSCCLGKDSCFAFALSWSIRICNLIRSKRSFKSGLLRNLWNIVPMDVFSSTIIISIRGNDYSIINKFFVNNIYKKTTAVCLRWSIVVMWRYFQQGPPLWYQGFCVITEHWAFGSFGSGYVLSLRKLCRLLLANISICLGFMAPVVTAVKHNITVIVQISIILGYFERWFLVMGW